jgi:hypothetical protein
MKFRLLKMVVLFCLVASGAATRAVFAQQYYDISSGGQPTITGALGGSVTANSDVTQNLSVIVNFGEVSPANTNSIVKVTVPITIRSRDPYQITVAMTASNNLDSRAIQLSDIGYGVRNLRPLGNKAQVCSNSSHVFNSLLNNDPAATPSFNSSGRVTYKSTLANLTAPTVILNGPKLTQGTGIQRRDDDGWVFDAVFVITPQFFAASTGSATLTFSISPGPNVPC